MTGTLAEAERRRTFAVISHPDAAKTAPTEKRLLFSGGREEAGTVQARDRRQRDVTSDWMHMELVSSYRLEAVLGDQRDLRLETILRI